MMASISMTRTVTTTVMVFASTAVSCVMVKTKTRSKKSSRVLTRPAGIAGTCTEGRRARVTRGSPGERIGRVGRSGIRFAQGERLRPGSVLTQLGQTPRRLGHGGDVAGRHPPE